MIRCVDHDALHEKYEMLEPPPLVIGCAFLLHIQSALYMEQKCTQKVASMLYIKFDLPRSSLSLNFSTFSLFILASSLGLGKKK